MTPPGGIQASVAGHPQRADAALAVLLALATAAGSLRGTWVDAWAWYAAAHVPLAWRRRRPAVVCWAVLGLTLAAVAAGVRAEESVFPELIVSVAVYTVARHAPLLQLVPVVLVLLVPATVTYAVGGWDQDTFALVLSLLVATVLLGVTLRTRVAYQGQLVERAAHRKHERAQELRLAAAAERARIARDVHDIVAHNLAVMIALADGAAVTSRTSPERAGEAMASVSATGRQALADMRRLLGVLQDDEDHAAGGTAPQPGLADVDDLVAQVRQAGLRVTLTVTGVPGAWGPGAELAVYRIVQEALTNTLKHAGPDAAAHVRLRYDDGGADVEVTDDGAGRPIADAGDGGRGVAGMVERATAYGGELIAGPLPDGAGWRVRATVRPGEVPA